MQRATLTALALLLFAGIASAQDGVRWTGDYRQAAELAAKERKLILLHFESDDCPPCRKLEANVFPRRDVAEAVAAGFVAVKVNVDKAPELTRRYSVSRWPTDVVVTPMGQEVYRQISPQDPAEYIARLKDTAARSGSAMARSTPPSQPEGTAGVTQPVGYQFHASRGKTALPDRSSEFQSPEIENGPPTAVEQQPAVPQQNEYVAKPQANPYALPPGSEMNSAAKPPVSGDDGTEYQGIERVTPRGSSESADTVGSAPSPAQPPRESAPPTPTATQPKAPILPPIGMEGYCVVTLAQEGKWAKGNKKFGAIHRGRLYLFGSGQAQKTFLSDPDRFAPALSGYDPVLFRETQKLVDGKRSHGLTFNGQVYVFASEESLRKFETSPKPFADTVYQAMLRSDKASKIR